MTDAPKVASVSQLPHQTITIDNQTKETHPVEIFNMIWAAWYAVSFHYGPSHLNEHQSNWVRQGLAPFGHVVWLPKGMKPPKGAWNVILLDSTNEQGALGWHDDENGSAIPYAEVFVQTAKQFSIDPAEVLCHELYEMLVDPNVDPVQPRVVKRDSDLWIVEVGDPLQGKGFDLGEPEGRETGVTVCDFALPSWFGLGQEPDSGPFSFRDNVKQFELAPEGYQSIMKEGSNNWEQIFGSNQKEANKAAMRDDKIARLVMEHSAPTGIPPKVETQEGNE